MTFLGEDDIAAMLADLAEAGGGVEVTLGGTTVTGLRDQRGRGDLRRRDARGRRGR